MLMIAIFIACILYGITLLPKIRYPDPQLTFFATEPIQPVHLLTQADTQSNAVAGGNNLVQDYGVNLENERFSPGDLMTPTSILAKRLEDDYNPANFPIPAFEDNILYIQGITGSPNPGVDHVVRVV
jgi:hypothetical protein